MRFVTIPAPSEVVRSTDEQPPTARTGDGVAAAGPPADACLHDLVEVGVRPGGALRFVFRSAAGEPAVITVRADAEVLAELRATADRAADLLARTGPRARPR